MKYCDEYVCLSVHSHNSKSTRLNFTKFLCMLPVAVAWSSSASIVTCCVVPVLWMMSCLHIMALWCVMCMPKWRQNMTKTTAEISTMKTCKYSLRAAHWGQSLLSTIALFVCLRKSIRRSGIVTSSSCKHLLVNDFIQSLTGCPGHCTVQPCAASVFRKCSFCVTVSFGLLKPIFVSC